MLAFSLLGSPGVRLLGNTSVRHHTRSRRGMGGLGDYDINTLCSEIPSGDPYRSSGNACTCNDGSNIAIFDSNGNVTAPDGSQACPVASSYTPSSSGSTPSKTAASSSAVPWYQSVAQGVATGAVKAALQPGMPGYVVPVATPWYTQWWGIGAIALLGVGAFVMLRPAPAHASTAVSGARSRKRKRS